jgi:hypothetical protein
MKPIIYVLILTVTLIGESVSITALEMESKESCRTAGKEWVNHKVGLYVHTAYLCIKK